SPNSPIRALVLVRDDPAHVAPHEAVALGRADVAPGATNAERRPSVAEQDPLAPGARATLPPVRTPVALRSALADRLRLPAPAGRLRLAAAALAFAAALGALPTRPAAAFVWPNVPDQVARGLASSDPSERRLAATRIGELPPEIGLGLAQKAMGDP